MSARFPIRGVIEGFYGRPWSARDRLDLLSFCGERGMNVYVYAPKDDPKHRLQWRDAYTVAEWDHFRQVLRRCRSFDMTFGFAVSPGLDIDYGSEVDRRHLLAKLRRARDLGATWLVVAFDDLPGRRTRGSAQAELVAWLYDALGLAASGLRLSVVPTEYAGITSSPYLSELADGLPPDVDVAWTGRWVVSPTVSVADAKARAAALGGRPPLLWDNYPVNDSHMSSSLFLGPYAGREPGLATACSGVLCNPMPLAHASKVALGTAAEFFSSGSRYQPRDAWHRAIREVAGVQAPVLEALALACADSALAPPAGLAIHVLVDAYEAGDASLEELARSLLPAREAASLVSDDPGLLWEEVRPWLAQLNREARAGLAAIRLLEALDGDVPQETVDAANGLQAAWSRARSRAHGVNVFGPRFASYPVLSWDADGAETLDLMTGVVEDASGIDRLCRLARDNYIRWCDCSEQVVGL